MNLKPQLQFLLSADFWKKTKCLVLSFVPHCLIPASLVCIPSLIVLSVAFQILPLIQTPVLNFEDVMRVAFSACLGMLVALGFVLVATWFWLIRLTAFCRQYLEIDAMQLPGQTIAKVKTKQVYLAKVWFFASLYLLLLVIPFFILSIFVQVAALELPSDFPFVISKAALVFCQIMLACLGLAAEGYSIVVMVLSAKLDFPPDLVARQALGIFGRNIIGITLLVVLVTIANILIGTPQVFMLIDSKQYFAQLNYGQEVLLQIWFALTTVILWTGSLAPFCEMLRKSIESLTVQESS